MSPWPHLPTPASVPGGLHSERVPRCPPQLTGASSSMLPTARWSEIWPSWLCRTPSRESCTRPPASSKLPSASTRYRTSARLSCRVQWPVLGSLVLVLEVMTRVWRRCGHSEFWRVFRAFCLEMFTIFVFTSVLLLFFCSHHDMNTILYWKKCPCGFSMGRCFEQSMALLRGSAALPRILWFDTLSKHTLLVSCMEPATACFLFKFLFSIYFFFSNSFLPPAVLPCPIPWIVPHPQLHAVSLNKIKCLLLFTVTCYASLPANTGLSVTRQSSPPPHFTRGGQFPQAGPPATRGTSRTLVRSAWHPCGKMQMVADLWTLPLYSPTGTASQRATGSSCRCYTTLLQEIQTGRHR